MKVYEKMNELIGTNVSKEKIKSWAYMNRIMVMEVHWEKEFESLEVTVEKFINDIDYHGLADEHEAWDLFLEYEIVEE